MAFQSVPDTLEVVVEGVMGGQQIINTHYAHFSGGYTQSDVDTTAETVDEWVGTSWLPLMPNNYLYTRTRVRGLNDAIDLAAEADTNTGVGGSTSSNEANNVSLAVKRRSAFTGRGARGRIFIPGIPSDQKASDNTVEGAFAVTIVSALNDLSAQLGGIGAEAVIVHRRAGGVLLDPAQTFLIIEWSVVDLTVDSMRRRLPGRGS